MTQSAIVQRQENIQTIVSAAPQSYNDNRASRDRCIDAGQTILDAIQQQGMTDELDQQAAIYIEKARKTVKKMNERRAPVTKLFDDIRKEFTAMENAIDPTKTDTIPFRLQQLRNQFAAKKLAEEEERRRAELARQQAEQARTKMRQDIEDDLMNQFQSLVNHACNELSALDNAVSLDNYDAVSKQIADYPTALPSDFIANLHTAIRIPSGISAEELLNVEAQTKTQLSQRFSEQYEFEVDNTRQYILDRLPSKRNNLQRIAQANAEEAERLRADMEARRRVEEAQKEAERLRKEAEERQRTELARQQAEIDSLFSAQAAAMQEYQPKAKVTKRIELLTPEGIMPIISMWWSKEGCRLSVDELSKMFRRQITFCERLANKEEVFITDENIIYLDDVKAK